VGAADGWTVAGAVCVWVPCVGASGVCVLLCAVCGCAGGVSLVDDSPQSADYGKSQRSDGGGGGGA